MTGLPSSHTVIFSAPQAWGKTRNAQALRQQYGCRAVVDEWDASQRLTPGALHLTNLHPDEVKQSLRTSSSTAQVCSQGW